ncbi:MULTISPECIES: hypothetical protein [Brevibacillus]|jgi:hypothetical protein|uniref:Uncharacterized protein n=2 Tax=Brevibacillus parabrevis TaxID=54914 RepID=A0A4Y3PBV9_BREPA|nr:MULTISPECIES: hypothetical protein [Brevibacillus]TGV30899.1 hypothetical protein EN829_035200 [Mesorhizobium sp. M00.F.Ca.ET.186.01.1.1]MBU8714907.1 hypothetical protein [Brevibacillus parabrevis]MDH6352912.1 hypothetical protein [Brevibacillus sp. 1238]MDR5000766.1 hypothetical protein [Brevibacillus parabrevis]MED2253127.1 hypothetical protein [Brevibacillus parabrevis]
MGEENPFHCCATCTHFRVEKAPGGVTYRCSRLTYETRPDYRFQCWTPTERVKRLMETRQQPFDSE